MLCLCDVVVAASDTRWRLPEVALGMVPTAVWPALSYRVSPAMASRLLLTRTSWGAQDALTWGLVAEVVPFDAVKAAVEAYASTWRTLPRVTLVETKKMLNLLSGDDFRRQMQSIRPWVLSAPRDPQAQQRIAALLAR